MEQVTTYQKETPRCVVNQEANYKHMAVDIRDEHEMEIVSEDPVILPKKKMRQKLLQNLVCTPPPIPLHWVTFNEFVDKTYKSFYPEDIVKDVFALVDRAFTKYHTVSGFISLDSDSESDDYIISSSNISVDKGNENSKTEENLLLTTKANELSSPPEPIYRTLPQEQLNTLKKDAAIKKHSRLIKEIYSLLNEIRDTTSCNVCTKMKKRIQKFKKYVSEECETIKTMIGADSIENRNGVGNDERAAELIDNRKKNKSKRKIQPADETVNTTDCGQTEILTEKEREKMCRDILLDRLIEICMPDIIRNNQLLSSGQTTQLPAEGGPPPSDDGGGQKTERQRRSRKKKSVSYFENSSEASPSELAFDGFGEDFELMSTPTKRKKSKKSDDVVSKKVKVKDGATKKDKKKYRGSKKYDK